ncbi:MAG TPA: hypothetical protein VJH63_02435 [Candidatus Paceibacterota bacterium]
MQNQSSMTVLFVLYDGVRSLKKYAETTIFPDIGEEYEIGGIYDLLVADTSRADSKIFLDTGNGNGRALNANELAFLENDGWSPA